MATHVGDSARGRPYPLRRPAACRNLRLGPTPNEWYRWQHNLRRDPDIRVLLSIDSSSFPLGTGPKPHEIWHGGDYPVVWTNTKYAMLYLNMGHNDIDYEHKTGKELSSTFGSETQNRLVLDGLLWLGRRKKPTSHP